MTDHIQTKLMELKDRFSAGRIPLEGDFAALIEVAVAGYRAIGLDHDQTGAGKALELRDDILNITVKRNGGMEVTEKGLGLKVREKRGIEIESDGVGLCDDQFLKRGMIMMWCGEISAIPYGWLLCDGENGTPDLRDKFVVGAGKHYEQSSVGQGTTHTGSATSSGLVRISGHVLTLNELPKHKHTYQYPSQMTAEAGVWKGGRGDGAGWPFLTAYRNDVHLPVAVGKWLNDDTSETGSAQAHSHAAEFEGADHEHSIAPIPPYYALAYIMKA